MALLDGLPRSQATQPEEPARDGAVLSEIGKSPAVKSGGRSRSAEADIGVFGNRTKHMPLLACVLMKASVREHQNA